MYERYAGVDETEKAAGSKVMVSEGAPAPSPATAAVVSSITSVTDASVPVALERASKTLVMA